MTCLNIRSRGLHRFVFVGLWLIILAFFQSSPAFAQNTCRLEIKKTGGPDYASGQLLSVDPADSITVRVTYAIYEGQTVNSPDDSAYYLVFPDRSLGFGAKPRIYIPASTFRNGTFTMEGISVHDNLADNVVNNVQLVRDTGPVTSHNVLCSTLNRVQVSSERCSINGRVTRRNDGSFNLGISVNTTQLNPARAYTINLDTGIRDTVGITFHPTAGANGVNYAVNIDSGHLDQTFTLYVRPTACIDAIGHSCALQGCTTEVFFDPNAEFTTDEPEPTEVLPVNAEPAEAGPPLASYNFCRQVPEGTQRTACEACVGDDVTQKIFTAIGCIDTSKSGLAGDLIRIGLGVGGGLALISILAGAFMFSTSQGDATKLKEAKGLITASVAGLLFMIFSAIILNFIGVEIFKIPGLG